MDKVTKVKGCTSDHSGTSAAAPIASGIIALMLSARYLNINNIKFI